MRRNRFSIALVATCYAALAATARDVEAAPVFFETFTPEHSTYSSGGWVLQGGDGFLGVRFDLAEQTHLEAIVGNLGGSGDFFVAIAGIEPGDETPWLAPDFAPGDVLFYATNQFGGFLSRDIRTAANLDLDAGRYLVFFGGLGPFGENDFGWMPNAPDDLAYSLVPASDYFEYRGSSWVNFPESGIRVALEGSPTAVPLPGGFLLLLTAIASSARYAAWRARPGSGH